MNENNKLSSEIKSLKNEKKDLEINFSNTLKANEKIT